MKLLQFAAERSARLNDFSDEIRPIVERALAQYGGNSWYAGIVEGAGVLWSEIFEKESPTDTVGAALDTFLRELGESLAKTTQPADPPQRAQVDRITNWVGVYAVNSATNAAARDSDSQTKTWVTMEDDAVRTMHREVDGQTVPIMGTFTVGGVQMHFPGEPVGTPDHYLNCRCLLAVRGGPEMGAKSTSFAVGDVIEEEGDGIHVEEPEIDEDEPLVDDVTEVPWHGVLVVEGKPTGDRRMFDVGSLSYRNLPLPLKFQRAGAEGHSGDVVVGTIDEIWLEGDEHRARGRLNVNVPEANEVIDGIVFGMFGGVSVDIDDIEVAVDFKEFDAEEDDDMIGLLFGGEVEMTRVTKGRIAAASIVAIPAFQEAYVALGPDFEPELRDPEAGADDADTGEDAVGTEIVEEEKEKGALLAAAFAPGTKDGPGWLTNPRDTQRLRNYWVHGEGAAKIRWGIPGDFNRCRSQLRKYVPEVFLAGTCANMHKEALGVWPGRERGDKHGVIAAPAFVLTASAAAMTEAARFFADPELDEPTPLTVTEDGHVFGHLAVWGSCHIGIGETCVMPPTSHTDYAFFATGQVLTEDGFVNTGRIVLGTGHAGVRESMAKASRFYDDTGHAVADIAVGEDTHGIWFSGKTRDGATPQQIKELRASAVSGDWRRASHGDLELTALLAVNNAGFPGPRFGFRGDKQVSLIASAGMLAPRGERKAVTASAFVDDADSLLAIGRVVADELEYRQDRRDRLARVRDPQLEAAITQRRADRIAAAKKI